MPILSTDYLKTFFAFLDKATDSELRERRQALEQLLEEVSDHEFQQNIRWMINHINEELLTRSCP